MRWYQLIYLCVLLASSQSVAFAADWLTHPLKPLLASQTTASLQTLANEQPLAVVFYQPDCPWCQKQMQQLVSYQQQCHHGFQSVFIGTQGKHRALLREVQSYQQQALSFAADSQFIRLLGAIPATPITLFIDQHGQLLSANRGLITAKLLAQKIAQLSNKKCS